MVRLLATCLTLFALIAPLPAQTLAHSLPADTLVYFRQTEPLRSIQKMAESNVLWANPVDIQKSFLDGADEMLGRLDQMMGIESGSLSTYLRSITLMEGALYRLEITDSGPDFEFAMVFETPMAEQIYKLLSGKLIEQSLAEEVGKDEIRIPIPYTEDLGLNVARRDNRVILANDQKRLNETMRTFGSTVEGSLVQDPRFKAAVSDGGIDHCLYIRADHFLRMLKEQMRFMREGSPPSAIATALGLFKIGQLGYVEGDKSSRLAILGNETVPLFEILATDNGRPEILNMLPSDTAVGVAYTGDGLSLWKRASSLLLDKQKFPMAGMLEENIRAFQESSGAKVEEIAALATGGLVFGFLPDENGRLDDGVDNFVFILPMADVPKAKETAMKLMADMTKRKGGEIVAKEEGETSWYHVERKMGEGEPPRQMGPSLAFTPRMAIVASERVSRRIMDVAAGKHPSLATVNATRGLKPGAAAYFYVGMKSILGQERELTGGYHAMRDGAGIAGAIDITKDRFILTTNLPIGEVANSVLASAVVYEAQDEQREAARGDLKKIAEAYRLYRGKNGKDPATLSELGFTGEKALAFPPKRPAGDPGKPYTLVPTGMAVKDATATDENQKWVERNVIIAYAPESTYGRIVATLDGDTRTMAESQFRRTLSRQQAEAAAPSK